MHGDFWRCLDTLKRGLLPANPCPRLALSSLTLTILPLALLSINFDSCQNDHEKRPDHDIKGQQSLGTDSFDFDGQLFTLLFVYYLVCSIRTTS